MDEATFQLWRASGFLVAAAVAVALERWRPREGVRPDLRVNGALWVLDAVVMAVICGGCACAVARWGTAHRAGLLGLVDASPLARAVATVLWLDLVSYGWHRANHRVPVLWRFHAVHHTDRGLTASTALRFHPGELLLSLPVRLLAVVLLGATPEGVIAFEVAFGFANLIEHGDIRVAASLERRLQGLLITPATHRRHHDREGAGRGSNFGTIFATWDRMFRSFSPSPLQPDVGAGLVELEAPGSIREALLVPLQIDASG